MATSCAALQVCLAEAGVCGSSQARRSIGAAERGPPPARCEGAVLAASNLNNFMLIK